jgi:hypothetical protein
MEFHFSNGQVKITMKGYIDKLLSENHIDENCSTPAGNDLFTITDEPLLSPEEQKSLHSLVAQL